MYELEWPREKADFRYIDREKNNIIEIINTNDVSKEFYNYSINFYISGRLLIEHLIPIRSNAKKDSWFFPIVYLYRQAIELILKAIVFKYIDNRNERIEYLREVRHDLSSSFRVLIEKLNLNKINTNLEEIKWLQKFLEDITYVDRESDVFRYPFSNTGKTFFNEQKNINLCYLRVNFNTAFEILNDIFNDTNLIGKKYKAYKPKFLIGGGDYLEQSVIGWSSSGKKIDFYRYVQGYSDAGDYLKSLLTKDNNKLEVLFLPMCYLYRNSVELSLKRILIEDIKIDYNRAMKIITRKKHSVLGIWNKVKSEIEKCANTDEDTTVSSVEKYIIGLQNIDSSSDKFRYPTDKNLDFHFNNNEKFDFENVALCFKELLSFLDAVDGELSARREWEIEMTNYYDDY